VVRPFAETELSWWIESLRERLGRDIQLKELASDDEARAFWQHKGWPDITVNVTFFAMKAFAENFEAIEPILAKQQCTAEHILGRPTRTYLDWVADNIAAFL
jgi:hypothetical protein